jgi:hypothetical protein
LPVTTNPTIEQVVEKRELSLEMKTEANMKANATLASYLVPMPRLSEAAGGRGLPSSFSLWLSVTP